MTVEDTKTGKISFEVYSLYVDERGLPTDTPQKILKILNGSSPSIVLTGKEIGMLFTFLVKHFEQEMLGTEDKARSNLLIW